MLAARWSWFSEGRFLGRVLDGWSSDTQEFVRNRLPHLLVVAAIAFILSRLLRIVTLRMTRVAEQHAAGPGRIAQVKTVSQVVRATGLTIIGVIAGLQFLDAVGINLGPLLASAGIAGVAIGLAAQNIVKDVLNGILILVEDQFNVGDTVRIAGLAGTVGAGQGEFALDQARVHQVERLQDRAVAAPRLVVAVAAQEAVQECVGGAFGTDHVGELHGVGWPAHVEFRPASNRVPRNGTGARGYRGAGIAAARLHDAIDNLLAPQAAHELAREVGLPGGVPLPRVKAGKLVGIAVDDFAHQR